MGARARIASYFLIAAAVFAAACSPSPIRIDIPFDSSDRSALIAVEEGGALEVYAVGEAERTSMPVLKRLEGFEPEDGMRITVLLYRRTLADYDIRPGLLSPAQNIANSRDVPNEDRIVQGTLGASGEIAWTELPDVPDPLADYRIEGRDRCAKLEGEAFMLGGEPIYTAIVPVGADVAWAFASEDVFIASNIYEVTEEGARKIETPAELSTLSVTAAARARNGQVWVSGVSTTMRVDTYVGTPETSFPRSFGRPSEVSREVVGWMKPGTADEDPSTIYSLTQRGDLERFANDEWTVLHDEINRPIPSSIGGLAVAAPDDIYFIRPGGKELWHYDGVAAVRVRTEVDSDLEREADILRSVGAIPGLGEFAGTENGLLLKREESGFNVVAMTPLEAHEIRSMVPFQAPGIAGESMLLTGRYGFVFQYDAQIGLCGSEDQAANLSSDFFIDDLVALDDGWVVGGKLESTTGASEAAAGFVSLRAE